MAGRSILETGRLQLREFDEGDAAPYYVLGSDPAIIRYTGDPGRGLTSLEHAREVLRSHPISDYQKYGYGRWACVHRASGEVIGFAGLKYLDDLKEVDLGYRLRPDYWGLGLATEAGRAVVDYGFAQLKLKQIIALVPPENLASARVLDKLGFTLVGDIEFRGASAAKYVVHARGATEQTAG